MADNTTLNAGTGGDTIASDDILGVKYQRVKIATGPDGTAVDNDQTHPQYTAITDGTDLALVDAGGNLQVSLSGTAANATAIKVDGSAVTQPVSIAATVTVDSELTTADLDTGAGTDTRAVVGLVGAKSGGGVLIPGDATKGLAVDLTATGANTTALKVDGSAVTQPVSAASLPLPTGAATAAKQPALGTAGTASADVITVQGIASMTALKVDGSGVTQPVSGTVTVQQSTASSLKVDLSGTAANATAIKVDGSAVTQPVSNAGTFAVQVKPTTSGGLSMASGTIAATKTAIKASAGQLYGWYFYNSNASVAYVQFFNVASASVTLGTTAPDLSIGIPATSAANVEFTNGIAFGTAITIAITTTRSGSTGPGSTVDYNILYA